MEHKGVGEAVTHVLSDEDAKKAAMQPVPDETAQGPGIHTIPAATVPGLAGVQTGPVWDAPEVSPQEQAEETTETANLPVWAETLIVLPSTMTRTTYSTIPEREQEDWQSTYLPAFRETEKPTP